MAQQRRLSARLVQIRRDGLMDFRFDDYVFQQISEKYLGGRLGFDVGCIYA